MSSEARPSPFCHSDRASIASERRNLWGLGRGALMPGPQISRFASLTRDDMLGQAGGKSEIRNSRDGWVASGSSPYPSPTAGAPFCHPERGRFLFVIPTERARRASGGIYGVGGCVSPCSSQACPERGRRPSRMDPSVRSGPSGLHSLGMTSCGAPMLIHVTQRLQHLLIRQGRL